MSSKIKISYKFNNTDALALRVNNAGREECEPLYQWGPGIRSNYVIHHIIKGKGAYAVGGARYELSEGDSFIIYPDTEIVYRADEHEPWEYSWVGFSGLTAAELVSHTDFTPDMPVIHTRLGTEIENIIARIYEAHGEGYVENLKMTGHLLLMFALFAERSERRRGTRPDAEKYARDAEEYMLNNYALPITVEDIAGHINISRSHLWRVFKEKYSASPKEYLSALRIDKACGMLTKTSLPVGSIANSVGFENHLYFSSAFKRLKGVSPSEYRRSGGV